MVPRDRPRAGDGPAPLRGPTCRMVVRARHHDTHASRHFSALVSSGDKPPGLPDDHVVVNMVVLGDEAGDCLTPGEDFALWRGAAARPGAGTPPLLLFIPPTARPPPPPPPPPPPSPRAPPPPAPRRPAPAP